MIKSHSAFRLNGIPSFAPELVTFLPRFRGMMLFTPVLLRMRSYGVCKIAHELHIWRYICLPLAASRGFPKGKHCSLSVGHRNITELFALANIVLHFLHHNTMQTMQPFSRVLTEGISEMLNLFGGNEVAYEG